MSPTIDLSIEWRRCCFRAMGYDSDTLDAILLLNRPTSNNSNSGGGSSKEGQIINLLFTGGRTTNNSNNNQLFQKNNDTFDNDNEPYKEEEEKEYDNDDDMEMDDDDEDDDGDVIRDPWMLTAVQIQSNLIEMSNWIRTKKSSYINVTMSDNEASLIQSTIMSFIATTANEIESLDQLLLRQQQQQQTSFVEQYKNHCKGIVQILMNQLKEYIIIPFNIAQKQRNRKAVKIWQNPYQNHVSLILPKLSNNQNKRKKEVSAIDAALGFDDESERGGGASLSEQKFLPTEPTHRLHQDFYSSYQLEHDTNPLKRPRSIFSPRDDENDAIGSFEIVTAKEDQSIKTSQPTKAVGSVNNKSLLHKGKPKVNQVSQQQIIRKEVVDNVTKKTKPNQIISNDMDLDQKVDMDYDQYYSHELQKEAMLLEATMNSDLDSVQQMERMMIDITTLLSQFAELAKEQQEDIYDIHKATEDTKENMEQGKNQLIDATQRKASSKHYMAYCIVTMGCILVLFHWLRP